MCAYEATSCLPSLLPIFAPNNIVHVLLYIPLQTKVGADHKNLLRIPHSSKTNKCISQQKKQNSEGNRGNLGKWPIAGGFSTLLVISNWEISIWGYSCLHRYVLSSIRFHRGSLSHPTPKSVHMQHLKENCIACMGPPRFLRLQSIYGHTSAALIACWFSIILQHCGSSSLLLSL